MTDPFAGYTPEETPKNPTLKFLTPGKYEDGTPGKPDTFVGKVDRISEVFPNKPMPNQTGDPGESFAVDLVATYVDITPVAKAGRQEAYTPPAVGETVVFFVKVGSADDKRIRAAAAKAGANGLEEGGELAIRFTEEIKSKFPQPFKSKDFIYTPPVKPAHPFGDNNAEAPF